VREDPLEGSQSSRAKGSLAFVVVAGLALGPAVALGFARFAYALLLPSMRSELHWSLAVAGAMNTANALGYLAGALFVASIARRYGTRRTFIIGLGVTVLSMLVTGVTGNIVVMVGLRSLAGIAGAICFVAGAGLVAELGLTSSSRRATMLLGIYFAGGGAGIVASGLVVPSLLAATSAADGWRWGWLLLAGLGIIALGVAIPAARSCREPSAAPLADKRWPARRLGALLASYALFGAGYIAYMTFIVAFLKHEGAGPGEISAFWVVLGAAAMAGAFAWTRPIAKLRGGNGPGVVLAVVTVGALLPILSGSGIATVGSAVLFGGSFLTVVTAVTVVARRSLEPHHWTPAIAALTVAFACGQSLGPVLVGMISEGTAGLSVGLSVSAGLLAAGALVALAQPHRHIRNEVDDLRTKPRPAL
jgi:predicted MFS family arabinose efflux permease